MRFKGTVLAVLAANLLTIGLLAGAYLYLKSDNGQMVLYEMGLHSFFMASLVSTTRCPASNWHPASGRSNCESVEHLPDARHCGPVPASCGGYLRIDKPGVHFVVVWRRVAIDIAVGTNLIACAICVIVHPISLRLGPNQGIEISQPTGVLQQHVLTLQRVQSVGAVIRLQLAFPDRGRITRVRREKRWALCKTCNPATCGF